MAATTTQATWRAAIKGGKANGARQVLASAAPWAAIVANNVMDGKADMITSQGQRGENVMFKLEGGFTDICRNAAFKTRGVPDTDNERHSSTTRMSCGTPSSSNNELGGRALPVAHLRPVAYPICSTNIDRIITSGSRKVDMFLPPDASLKQSESTSAQFCPSSAHVVTPEEEQQESDYVLCAVPKRRVHIAIRNRFPY